MTNLKISYLITCCNETDTLIKLLSKLHEYTPKSDQIVMVWDKTNGSKKTKEIIDNFHAHVYETKSRDVLTVQQIPFNNNYAAHKNQVIEMANQMNEGYPKTDFFFQIDGDELPSDTLIFNIREIISTNKSIELIYVPRINDYKGVTQEHAKKWGWRLTQSNKCEGRYIVQWPDYQGRIFKNDYPRIHWERKLHEKIEGHTEYAFLPQDEDFSLYHDKTIETQIQTNLRYNKQFSVEDNLGHKVT